MSPEGPRVILNDRALHRAWTGVAQYVAQLSAAIRANHPDIHLMGFYQTCVAPLRGRLGKSRSAVAPGHAERRSSWMRRLAQESYNLALEMAGLIRGCRVYHEPNHIPAPWPGPVVTTIHDLSVLRHPEWHPADRVRWYEREFFASLDRSDHFITVSAFSRQEMIELAGIEPDRITVIPLAARSVFRPRPAHETQAWLAERGLPRDYLLYAGTLEPRKNVPGLVEAYGSLAANLRRRCPLLIAGAAGWGRESIEELIGRHGLDDDVRVLGYVDDETLAGLYGGARALVWPTYYEGFGLPPLECMASGTPVITSRVCSLPEVTGDAALLVDPRDVGALRAAMHQVVEDDSVCQDLRSRSIARSQAFSWAACASAHADIYRRLSKLSL